MYEMITHPIHSPPHGSDPDDDDNNLTGLSKETPLNNPKSITDYLPPHGLGSSDSLPATDPSLADGGASPPAIQSNLDGPRGRLLRALPTFFNRECTEGRAPRNKPRVPVVSLLDASRLAQVRPRPRDGIILVRVDAEDEGRGILVFPGPEVVVVP